MNVKKTKAMVFSANGKDYDPTNAVISINNVVVEHVTQTKFLGVIIDRRLLWNEHVKYISGNISKNIGLLWRAKYKLGMKALLTLYNTLILPYLQYCIIVWGKTNKTILTRLYKLQKKAIRIITFSDRLAHTDKLFEKMSIMKLGVFCFHIYVQL